MSETYSFTVAQRLLIKPFERVRFVVFFILYTSLCQGILFFIFQQPAFDALWKQSKYQYAIVTGIITGTFVGASQWLVVRKYVPDWKWILAVSIGSTFISYASTAQGAASDSILHNSTNPVLNLQVVLFFLGTIIFSVCTFFLDGYLQWLVLRPYIVAAKWWLFLHFIALILTLIPIIIPSLTHGLVRFDSGVLLVAIKPAAQAISFCILYKKIANNTQREVSSQVESNLSVAPNIVNYWRIQSLGRKLYKSLNRVWQTDLNCNEQLIYLIGVNSNGTIFDYKPMNQAAIDYIDQTPLPNLTHHSDSTDSLYLAKFQVVFTPPATVKIYSCSGIPLLWLGVGVYLVIIGISTYPMWY